MNCSDYSTAWVCRTCGSLISLGYEDVAFGDDALRAGQSQPGGEYCRVCRGKEEEREQMQREREREREAGESVKANGVNVDPVRFELPKGNVLGGHLAGGDLDVVAVPYVFRYLCAELASMGIAISLEVR